MKQLFFLLFLLLSSSLSALTLGDEFQRAEVGDFVVFLEQKHLTLLRIADRTDQYIAIEEVTAPEKNIDEDAVSWQKWLHDGAPNHTSWTLSILDLKLGKIAACYSFTTNEWQASQTIVSFLPTLLALPLEPVPGDFRKRIGPAPDQGERDLRKFWVPKVFFNRIIAPPMPFDVRRADWPKDGSELQGKVILLYIPRGNDCLNYFPYWIEVVGLVGRVKLRVIDSGKGLSSPKDEEIVKELGLVMNSQNRAEK